MNDDEEEGEAVAGGSNVGVEAVGVSKRYGKLEALKPLNLTMSKGEVTGKSRLSLIWAFSFSIPPH